MQSTLEDHLSFFHLQTSYSGMVLGHLDPFATFLWFFEVAVVCFISAPKILSLLWINEVLCGKAKKGCGSFHYMVSCECQRLDLMTQQAYSVALLILVVQAELVGESGLLP